MASRSERLTLLAAALGLDYKNTMAVLFGAGGSLASLNTTDKSSFVAAINELRAAVTAAGAGLAIDDADANGSTTSVYSSEYVLTLISNAQAAAATAAVAAITDSAPGTLDTLNELAAALGDDANYANTVSTALGNRLRVDAAQGLTEGQKAQGRTNLGVYSIAQEGDPDTDLVAAYTAAKA